MYIKKIKISGYGSIDSFDYSFSKDGNGNPRPLVLLGKNGSGKSLVLANLVDALVEIKRKVYPGGILEVNGSNYYKVGKKTYVKSDKLESVVNIDFENNDKTLHFHDVMSRDPEKSLKDGNITREVGTLFDHNRFKDNGFDKGLRGEISVKDFEEGEYLYFPVDRYYVPNWFNPDNYTKIDYDSNGSVGKSNKNIIKINIADNIYRWLYKLFSRCDYLLINGGVAPIVDQVQNHINNIVSLIKGKGSAIGTIDRKTDNIPVRIYGQTIADIKNLSSGEMNLLSMFSSIIKEYDENHAITNPSEINGICIIDEIDLNLHIEQQANVLPKLIKLFPKIQFIISTHSPFFVKGMFENYGNDVDFVEMPSGRVINDWFDFGEIKEAIKALQDSGNLIEKIEKHEKEYQELLKDKNRILVLTEGKTDAKYIIKAFEKLNRSKGDLTIETADRDDMGHGDTQLDQLIQAQRTLGKNANKIIAVFDDDDKTIKDKYPSNQLTEIVPGKVYAFRIPTPNKRSGESNISIEHYFTNEELRTADENGRRMYQLGEFYPTGPLKTDTSKTCVYVARNHNKHSDNYVLSGSDDKKVTSLDGTINYSLSKNDFCDKVVNDVEGFDTFDFSDFALILDTIEQAKSRII